METFKIYRLRSVNIESTLVYCSEGETCKMFVKYITDKNNINVRLYIWKIMKCFKTFQIFLSNDVNFEPFMFRKELFLSIFVSLKFEEDQQILNFTLDSDAQINCISQYFLKKNIFSKYELKMQNIKSD